MSAVTEDFFSDTALIGIGSPLPAHKFCWTINRNLDLKFTREPEFDIEIRKGPEDIHFFSLYQYNIPYSSCSYLLYKLRSERKALLPEIKQLDYLWLVSGQSAELEVMEIADNLRNINGIQLAQIIDRDRIKNLNYLIL